jgi:hypothetical protein
VYLRSREVSHFSVFFCPSSGELLALPFYRLKGRIRLTTNPRRCLGEGGATLLLLLWRRAPVHAGHPWGVMVMLMMGRQYIWGAAEDV